MRRFNIILLQVTTATKRRDMPLVSVVIEVVLDLLPSETSNTILHVSLFMHSFQRGILENTQVKILLISWQRKKRQTQKTNMVEYSFLRTPFGKTLMLHSVLFLSLSDLLIWIHWLFVYRHRWSSGPKMTVAWKRSSIIQLVSTKKWASKEENWRRTEITTPSLLRICVDHCDW